MSFTLTPIQISSIAWSNVRQSLARNHSMWSCFKTRQCQQYADECLRQDRHYRSYDV